MTNLDSKMLDFIDDFALSEADLNERVEFLLSAFLPQKMITTIYADGGNGKSYLSAAVAKALAAKDSVRQIIYVDLDNPLSALLERGYKENLLNIPKIKYLHRGKIKIHPNELLIQLESCALGRNYEGVVLILDSLRNFCDIDNDKQAMELFERLMNLREAGATIIALHHSNKDGRNFKGSSNIRNSTDIMFALERLEGEDGLVSVNLRAEKECVGIESKAFGIRLKDLMLCEINPLVANMNAKTKDFVAKAKAHLSKGGANKTQLLLACGFEKDDKFARGVLDDFEGIFWRVSSGGYKNKALLYELIKGGENECEKCK